MEDRARYGWESDFPIFRSAKPLVVRESLQKFITDASREQIRAWDDSIPELQREVGEIADHEAAAPTYTTILEYELPLESRRADAVHRQWHDRFANLVLLTDRRNPAHVFDQVRTVCKASAFETTKEIGLCEKWNTYALTARSDRLCLKAISRWSRPR